VTGAASYIQPATKCDDVMAIFVLASYAAGAAAKWNCDFTQTILTGSTVPYKGVLENTA